MAQVLAIVNRVPTAHCRLVNNSQLGTVERLEMSRTLYGQNKHITARHSIPGGLAGGQFNHLGWLWTNPFQAEHFRLKSIMNIFLEVTTHLSLSSLSDTPILRAKDAEYYPGPEDIRMITEWSKYTIAKALTDNFPAFGSCKKHIKCAQII